uniref:Glycosyltransferase n=1 Tax=Roseihalotalea indica TaxID=2867963 RepID=A0AA49GMG7_9BACT|nr:glycosyltransferase [Tunicatimonas sp. TK19036]
MALPRIEDYIDVAGESAVYDLHQRARKLYGKTNLHINSTFFGGGVAEILNSMIPLLNDIPVHTEWDTFHGHPDFYEITKKIHNAMQGDEENLTEEEKEIYLSTVENFSIYSHIGHDFVFIHDPQPLPLVRFAKKCQPWVWRCHLDISSPNPEIWRFLKQYMLRYDVIILSCEKYRKKDLPVEQRIIHPAINPLSAKNKELTPEEVKKCIEKANIPTDKPIITQVSRMDPWKDPEGVLDVFEKVRQQVDCRLLFCYNLADDDPEGESVYQRVRERAREQFSKEDVLFIQGNNAHLVNAIQRFSSVILQKSIREGFCLTVTEAMWKAKPVIATTAGGIPEQIEHEKHGFLLDPKDIDAYADCVVEILNNPSLGEEVGKRAKERVRDKFLTTRLMRDYLDLMIDLRS